MVALASNSLPAEKQSLLLRLLQSADLTLAEIALSLDLAPEELTRFLASDEGLALAAQGEVAAAVRARSCALSALHAAVDALSLILKLDTAAVKAEPADAPTSVAREHRLERARRAATLLFRIATFVPRPIRAIVPASPPQASCPDAASPDAPSPSKPAASPRANGFAQALDLAQREAPAAAPAAATIPAQITTSPQHHGAPQRAANKRTAPEPASFKFPAQPPRQPRTPPTNLRLAADTIPVASTAPQ